MPLGEGRPRSREHRALGCSDGWMWGRAEVGPRPGAPPRWGSSGVRSSRACAGFGEQLPPPRPPGVESSEVGVAVGLPGLACGPLSRHAPPSYLGAEARAGVVCTAGGGPDSSTRHGKAGGGSGAEAAAPGSGWGQPGRRGRWAQAPAGTGVSSPVPPSTPRPALPPPGAQPLPYSSEPRDPHATRLTWCAFLTPSGLPRYPTQPHRPFLGPKSQSHISSQPLKTEPHISSQPPNLSSQLLQESHPPTAALPPEPPVTSLGIPPTALRQYTHAR